VKAVFIETSEFTEWVSEHLTDDLYSSLQQELMADPEKGDVIKGCGGLRKVRVADPKRKKG
jgi:putative transcriptional regulator